MKTADRARGKWRGILLQLGIEDRYLTGKHGPCPFCEGKDRFRWDNEGGNGSFICSQCGAGDGFEFLKRAKGWDFKTTAKEVDAIVGGVTHEPIRPKIDPERRTEMLNRLWSGGMKLNGEDMASLYLAGRNVLPSPLPSCLRFTDNCPRPYGDGYGPAMLALVTAADGSPVNIHRTFLGPNGKADMQNPRAMMPGEVPDGSAVRLFPVHGARLGIAEGIETALAAAKRFGVPTWAALNATMLGKWVAPAGVEEVVVFGDCDPAFGGQASAYALAHRLAARHRLKVEVRIPQAAGLDWADSDAA
jgi:putative DNA primase/helicase